MPIDVTTWYDPNPDLTAPYQGDVYDGVPVVVMPPASGSWVILRPTQPVTLQEALKGRTPQAFKPHAEANLEGVWNEGDEFVLARGTKRRVMITTQTCDIDNRNFLHAAPVYSISTLAEAKRKSMRNNDVRYCFYLPDDEFADLSQAALVHKSYLRRGQLFRRLTTYATIELQVRLAAMQSRVFGFSQNDKAPQTAEYACISCFTKSAAVERVTIAAGDQFPACPGCADEARWIKLRQP